MRLPQETNAAIAVHAPYGTGEGLAARLEGRFARQLVEGFQEAADSLKGIPYRNPALRSGEFTTRNIGSCSLENGTSWPVRSKRMPPTSNM